MDRSDGQRSDCTKANCDAEKFRAFNDMFGDGQ